MAARARPEQAGDDRARINLPQEFTAPGHPGRGGRPVLSDAAKDALWAHLLCAIQTLVDCFDSPNAMARRQAADSIIDRTLGKPRVPVEIRVGVDWDKVPLDMLEAYLSLYAMLLERYPAQQGAAVVHK